MRLAANCCERRALRLEVYFRQSRSGHGFVDMAGRQNWLEERLGAWSGQKNESGRRAVGTGRPKTRQFVSLAQELYWHGFGKPRGICPRFAKKLIDGLL